VERDPEGQAGKSIEKETEVWVAEREKLGARLDPALREWADKVIIPALAREYLAERDAKRIAEVPQPVSEFTLKIEPSARVTP
jgi:hypothetical protein